MRLELTVAAYERLICQLVKNLPEGDVIIGEPGEIIDQVTGSVVGYVIDHPCLTEKDIDRIQHIAENRLKPGPVGMDIDRDIATVDKLSILRSWADDQPEVKVKKALREEKEKMENEDEKIEKKKLGSRILKSKKE